MEEKEIVKKLSKKYNKSSEFIKLLIKISKNYNDFDYYKDVDYFLLKIKKENCNYLE